MTAAQSSVDRYLELVRRVLLDQVDPRPELIPVEPTGVLKRAAVRLLGERGLELVRRRTYDPARRAQGKGWPQYGYTMVGEERLLNLERCVRTALGEQVPRDLAETGVWRGGASIHMRAILAAYGVTDRTVWVADSFMGLPPPDPRYPADAGSDLHEFAELSVSLAQVQANFARFGLLDDQVAFLEGWFKDTLPSAPIAQLAVLRLDGDLYQSTIDALASLYPKVSRGGFVIVDDYLSVDGCRRAVDDYRAQHGIVEEIVDIDWSGVYWRRER